MPATINIQKAGEKDFETVCKLLLQENLPIADLNPLLENFFIAVEDNKITGVIGMDRYGKDGLLRSAIVQKEYRNKGIAAALVARLFDEAAKQGVSTLYLITNTAAAYFEKKGFKKITKAEVAPAVLESKEFNGLCPASSIIMVQKL